MIGQRLLHYEVLEKLGQGGMASVYLARDTHLDRLVALKILPSETADEKRRLRFLREAKAVSALHHTNIVTIHDIATENGVTFIAMEYLRGKTLDDLLRANSMRPARALHLAIQMAEALSNAHAAGIIHRDLKPSNIMIDISDSVKILDFGLAKLTDPDPISNEDATVRDASITDERQILGTVAYMSPEQAEGKAVDARTDIFSFGAVLYEMLAGEPAFRGSSFASIIAAVMREEPRLLRNMAPGTPVKLQRIVVRCLQKRVEDRYASGSQLVGDLLKCQADLTAASSAPINFRSLARRSMQIRIILPIVLAVLALTAAIVSLVLQSAHTQWARYQALPEIARLIDEDHPKAAYAVAERAEEYISADPRLMGMWSAIARRVTIDTTPSGADVYRMDYGAKPGDWIHVGRSPLKNLRIPVGLNQWRIEKPGFAPIEGSLFPSPFTPPQSVKLTFDALGKQPYKMVRVPVDDIPFRLQMPGLEGTSPISLQGYWIDKYEVTNKDFKEFIDRGGYNRKEFWEQQFVKDGRVLSWEEANRLFRDSTDWPGPLNWVQGEYPPGQDNYPVSGISWFEAAAYAKFAGKVLPTIWQWDHAAGIKSSNYMVPASNFNGLGPAVVGSHRGIGPWGTYDMAGNVKEWCWNNAEGGKRYILGGAWDEPHYMFTDPDARSPFERSINFGFRCAKYVSPPTTTKANDPVLTAVRDYSREKPVSEKVFQVYKSLYSYDKKPLNENVQALDSFDDNWNLQKISFDAAYEKERVIAYLFMPKKAKAPLQTVIFFPGSYAISARSSSSLIDIRVFDFILKSGRAVLYPVYKGTYERGDELKSDIPDASSLYRDHVIEWSKDLSRSVDYLETRTDVDRNKLAYYGFSWGAALGAILPVLETRLKVCVLSLAGFYLQKTRPEVDIFNFAPHLTTPALMLNGRYDFLYPVQSSQVPMYSLLGTPRQDKRHILYDSGHNIPRNELIKETLAWLNRYLGQVN